MILRWIQIMLTLGRKKKATAEEFWAGLEELKKETDRRIKYLDELFTVSGES